MTHGQTPHSLACTIAADPRDVREIIEIERCLTRNLLGPDRDRRAAAVRASREYFDERMVTQ